MRERATRLAVEPVNIIPEDDYDHSFFVCVAPAEWEKEPWCPRPRDHLRLELSDEKQQELKKMLLDCVLQKAEWQSAGAVAPTGSQRRLDRHVTQFTSRRVWVPKGCKADAEVSGLQHWRADYYHGSETSPLHRYLVASRESADMTKMHQDIRNLCAVARDAVARPYVITARRPEPPEWQPWAAGTRDAPTGIAWRLNSRHGWRLRTDFTTWDEAVERIEEWKLPNARLLPKHWAQWPTKKAGPAGRVKVFPVAPVGHYLWLPQPKHSTRARAVYPPLIPPKRGVKRDLPMSPPLPMHVAKARPCVGPAIRPLPKPRWQYTVRPVVKYPPRVPAPPQVPPGDA